MNNILHIGGHCDLEILKKIPVANNIDTYNQSGSIRFIYGSQIIQSNITEKSFISTIDRIMGFVFTHLCWFIYIGNLHTLFCHKQLFFMHKM